MTGLLAIWYMYLFFVILLGIKSVRFFVDAFSSKTPYEYRDYCFYAAMTMAVLTVGGSIPLFVLPGSYELRISPLWVVLVVLAALALAWNLGLLSAYKTDEEDEDPEGLLAKALRNDQIRKLNREVQKNATLHKLGDEIECEIENMETEKPLPVERETVPTGKWYDNLYSWRARDFKGTLVEWLAANGPKSRLVPATFDLYKSLPKGVYTPYWNKGLGFNSKGVSLRIWDKPKFFRWDQLVFRISYSPYESASAIVVAEASSSSIHFAPSSVRLVTKDGTEIGYLWNRDEEKLLGNFEVDLELPAMIVSRGEKYIFEYQDGISGYYDQEIPVWYYASDLAKEESN